MIIMKIKKKLFIICLLQIIIFIIVSAENPDQNRIWLLEVVKSYADAMIENGLDV